MRNYFERLNNWFSFKYNKRNNNNNSNDNSDRYNLFKTYDDTLKIINH